MYSSLEFRKEMEDSSPISSPPQEVYISQKLKAFMSEPQGSAVVAALETHFHCIISVVNDLLIVKCSTTGMQADAVRIENILRDMWQKRDVQIMIREAALNVSCTHICQMILPRAYCAVVFFFSSDITRRSRCNDIIIDHFNGKVTMFGAELAVNKAREVMIECLTDHFGLLEIEIPIARRTTRMGYNLTPSPFNPEAPPPVLNNVFSIGEPNAILTSTPPLSVSQIFDEGRMSSNFDRQLQLFPSDFSVPPPQLPSMLEPPVILPPVQTTNNVEKVKQWIPTTEVGKILGNRAAMKKQIEGQFNCVITVHTEVYSHFGMTSVEIMAQNKEQCHGARNAVLSLIQAYQDKPTPAATPTDSGINSPSSPMTIESPSATPEKRSGGQRTFHRSSFRDQPKVMLALTPRKVSPSNE
ncbi:hypothetical protein L3Y34_014933 [Caenorhabditis briggsae]|uniref:K Homology domain-containing protein n=3 Tax=Caenorhabditis briggsae TaxID=6238 RepID=A0AAE9DS76_CAEBR|nr:hypothetical protein L3Y34_014933 [Caenorhabditis briggsae]